MIQRIQTVFLLLSTFILGLLFLLPVADISAAGEFYVLKIDGIFKGEEMVVNGIWHLIFLITIILLHLYAILTYKKRLRQIGLVIFILVLLIVFSGLFFWIAFMSFKEVAISFKIPVAFPVVAIILDYLAIRGIRKDEAPIRSLNRIR